MGKQMELTGIADEAYEYAIVCSLMSDCDEYLDKWRAEVYTTEDAPADAFVAVLELKHTLVTRRQSLLLKLDNDPPPF